MHPSSNSKRGDTGFPAQRTRDIRDGQLTRRPYRLVPIVFEIMPLIIRSPLPAILAPFYFYIKIPL